jgi:hypothetical protein
VILKPRLQIGLAEDNDKNFPKLEVANRGPGHIRLESPVVKLRCGFLGLLSKIDEVLEVRPFGQGSPPKQKWSSQMLSVGDKISMLLDDDSIKRWRRVGIRDVFGRIHWASDQDLKKMKRAHAN